MCRQAQYNYPENADLAFSCKTRSLCPSCAAKSGIMFAENLVENVFLPYQHGHCVFTVPKRIRQYFKFNRELLAHLYLAAWEAWKELVLEQHPTGPPAAITALHSAGDLFVFHPHVLSIPPFFRDRHIARRIKSLLTVTITQRISPISQ